jgi:hypothetical protein
MINIKIKRFFHDFGGSERFLQTRQVFSSAKQAAPPKSLKNQLKALLLNIIYSDVIFFYLNIKPKYKNFQNSKNTPNFAA